MEPINLSVAIFRLFIQITIGKKDFIARSQQEALLYVIAFGTTVHSFEPEKTRQALRQINESNVHKNFDARKRKKFIRFFHLSESVFERLFNQVKILSTSQPKIVATKNMVDDSYQYAVYLPNGIFADEMKPTEVIPVINKFHLQKHITDVERRELLEDFNVFLTPDRIVKNTQKENNQNNQDEFIFSVN